MDAKTCAICGFEHSDDVIKCPRCNVRLITKIEAAKRFIKHRPAFSCFLAALIISPIIGSISTPARGWLVFLILCFPAIVKIIAKLKMSSDTVIEKSYDDDYIKRNAEYDKIRNEIKDAVSEHSPAVNVLMALCRKDGKTSEAERRIVFAFLNRHGTQLTLERHWPHFQGNHAGEWERAVTLAEIGQLCYPLKDSPQNYRIAVAAAAQAIVASGKTPKKEEQAALEIIQLII